MAPEEVPGASGRRTLEFFPRYSSLVGEETRLLRDTPPFDVSGLESVPPGTLPSVGDPAGEGRDAPHPEPEGDEGTGGSSGYLAPGNPEA